MCVNISNILARYNVPPSQMSLSPTDALSFFFSSAPSFKNHFAYGNHSNDKWAQWEKQFTTKYVFSPLSLSLAQKQSPPLDSMATTHNLTSCTQMKC